MPGRKHATLPPPRSLVSLPLLCEIRISGQATEAPDLRSTKVEGVDQDTQSQTAVCSDAHGFGGVKLVEKDHADMGESSSDEEAGKEECCDG